MLLNDQKMCGYGGVLKTYAAFVRACSGMLSTNMLVGSVRGEGC